MKKTELDEVITRHILYVVMLPPNGTGEFSPFQGFSENTFAVADTIQYICRLPTTIDEMFRTRDEAIQFRSIGLAGYAIVLLELESLVQFDRGLPVTCFVSDRETREEVEKHLAAKNQRGWLHLTTDTESSSVPKLWDFSRADLASWSRKAAEKAIFAKSPMDSLPPLSWRKFVQWPKKRARTKTQSHNITLPTETALRSLNFVLPKAKRPLAGKSDDEFAVAISDVADELERVRHDADADHHRIPGSPMLVVTVPSVYRHLSPSQLKPGATPAIKRVFRNILRQKQYIAMTSTGQELKEILEDPIAPALMRVRAEELSTYTAALSVTASSFCAPVVRCPPQVDRVRDLLIRLSGMTRSKTPNTERRNKLAYNIGKSLRSAVPSLLLQRIEKYQDEGIKLIGDTPLELLPVNDLPLGVRATVSRLPTLPGNLLMRHGLARTPMLLEADALHKVLLVRAFERTDPLRNLIINAIEIVNSSSDKKIDLHIADVSTKKEFVDAFNSFDGHIAIFDGHGVHDRTSSQGTLRIGSIQLNPFELYKQMKVPPIILLSACETHPLEGIESSVASGFLMMGARSVLGTIVPIDGRKAAVLIARFMLRFTDFLPWITTMISWSQVVSGMLKMSYVTDILRTIDKQFSIGERVYKELHTSANNAINGFQSGWFEQLLASIASEVSMSDAEVRDVWMRTCYFTETLHYVHLGQPEHMFVVPVERPSSSS